MTLRSAAINASKWSALGEIATRGIPPLVFLILAYLLTPEDFGIVAIATMIISFAQIFWEAGLNKAVIQREGDLAAAANVVFWTNIGLGLVIYGALLLGARPLSVLFHEPKSQLVIQIQGLIIVLSSFSAIFIALHERNLNFRILFWTRLLTALTPGLVSIPLALGGFRYWSIVAGSTSGAFLQLVVLWFFTPWRPRFRYDLKIAKELLSFGAWVTGESFLSWLYMWADSLIIGIYLGTHNLGLYRTAHSIINMLYGLLFNPFLPVLYSTFSRMQDNLARIINILQRVIRLFSFVSFPIAGFLFILQAPLLDSLLSTKWQGIGPILGWLGLMYGLSWTVGVNSTVYRAIGRPDINTKFMCLTIVYYLPTYYFSIQFGIDTFLQARLLVTLVSILMHFVLAQRVLLLDIGSLAGGLRGNFIAAVLMVLSLYVINNAGLVDKPLWIQVTLNVLSGLFLYSIFSFRQWGFVKEMALSLVGKDNIGLRI